MSCPLPPVPAVVIKPHGKAPFLEPFIGTAGTGGKTAEVSHSCIFGLFTKTLFLENGF